MKTRNIFAVLVLLAAVFAVGYFAGQQSFVKAKDPIEFDHTLTQTQTLKWEVSDDQILSVVKKDLKTKCDGDSGLDACQELSIFDGRGHKLYGLKDFAIESFEVVNFTRQGTQLLIKTNGGGTDDFLTLLDYRNGKVVVIIDSGETQMRGGYWTMPEYRSGNPAPYFKPNQIFIINQLGGSDPNPEVSIFRYKDGFYKKAGQLQMQKLGDFIEVELNKGK